MRCVQGEIDLIPAQVCKLGRPQAVAEGDKDHGGIPVTPAIGLGGIDQPIDLGAGQVLPSPIDRVRFSSRQSDCSIYGGWSQPVTRTPVGAPGKRGKADPVTSDAVTATGRAGAREGYGRGFWQPDLRACDHHLPGDSCRSQS